MACREADAACGGPCQLFSRCLSRWEAPHRPTKVPRESCDSWPCLASVSPSLDSKFNPLSLWLEPAMGPLNATGKPPSLPGPVSSTPKLRVPPPPHQPQVCGDAESPTPPSRTSSGCWFSGTGMQNVHMHTCVHTRIRVHSVSTTPSQTPQWLAPPSSHLGGGGSTAGYATSCLGVSIRGGRIRVLQGVHGGKTQQDRV